MPKLKGLDAIVVIVDWFMKMIRLKVIITTVLLGEIAKIYRDNIWKLYGVLWKVFSDRGPQFTLKFIEDLTKILGTKRVLSIVYHLQIDS